MNEELFQTLDSLTFDDLLVVPGYSEVLPAQVDIRTTLVLDIQLNAPLLSARRVLLSCGSDLGGPVAVVQDRAAQDAEARA